MKAKIIVGLVAFAAGGILLAAIAAISSLTLLRPAPEVRFTALSGEAFTTSELRGKVVLVAFWATYCAPCMREMPKMVQAYGKFAPRGFETIAVAVHRDNPRRVVQFSANLPFKVALDSSGVLAKEFGNVRITPTAFLIDKQGRILRRYVGEPDWAEFHQLVERALKS